MHAGRRTWRGTAQSRQGKIQYVPCWEKTSRGEEKTALLRRDGGTKFSHENLFLLKKQKQGKAVFPSQQKKKKKKKASRQAEILRFCSEKVSLASLLLARQQGLVLISVEKI